MENSSTLLCTIALTTLFLFHLLRPRAALAPPSPPRLPIIGHLHLLTGMPHHALARLSRKLGPIISLQLGQVPTLIISSAKHAELILKNNDHIFANRPETTAAKCLSFGCSDVTFSPLGPYWRQARKIVVTELLSQAKIASFRNVRDEEVKRLVQSISDKSGSELDLSELLFALANDVLCRVAFGKRFIGEEEKRNVLDVLAETQALYAGFCIGDFFPSWEWIVSPVSGMKRRLMKNLEELREVCDEIINDHLRERKNRGEGREDFVDVLLKVQKRSDLQDPITDDNLKALILDMFVAGTDTTSSTLEWTMTELARNPTVMKRAQDEVRKTIGRKGNIEENDLRNLRYMRAVIKEAMRMHPPVPLLVPRESMEKCTLDGYEIPAETRVLINTYAIGRDPDSWENPSEFRPERFLEQDIEFTGQDFRFLPFGGGRRGCPGYGLGLATIELALTHLLYRFNWRLPPGIAPDNVDLDEVFGLATRKKSALKLVPTVAV